MMSQAVECFVDARADLAESPLWSPANGALHWVDIMAGAICTTDPSTGDTTTIALPVPVGCLAPRASGGLVAAAADGFWAVGADGAARCLVAVDADDPDTRFNDGQCDPAGRFWAGTMAYDLRPRAGSLYRLDPDLSVHRMLEGVTVSNGIDWSLDGRRMYYVDTATQRIDVFDYDVDHGTLARRRPFVTLPVGRGSPDGLVVDADDGIWVALWGGWAIRRYRPDGQLDLEVPIPAAMVTSLAFGGADLGDLYVTTARRLTGPEDEERQPHAGGIFRLRPGVRGRPAYAFGG